MRSPSFLAVDCGASHLAVGRFRRGPQRRLVLDEFVTEALPTSAPDEAGWIQGIAMALQRIGARTPLRGPCVVGLPGHLTLHKTVRIPGVPARQRRSILRFEVGQCLPCAPGEVLWSQVPVAADKDGEELVITAVRRATMVTLCDALRRAGTHPVAVFPAWLVLREALAARNPGVTPELLAGIGARSTQLVGVAAGSCFARSIALGGDSLTQEIASQLNVNLDRAECLKRCAGRETADSPVGAPENMAFQVAAEQFIRRLTGEILRSLACFGPPGDIHRPTVLRLAGGGSLLANLPGALGAGLDLRVATWEDPRPVVDEAGIAGTSGTLEGSHRAGLSWLAACAGRRQRNASSLLPSAVRRRLMVRRWWPAIAAAALLAVIGPVLAGRQAQDSAREFCRATAELDARISAHRRLAARHSAALARLAEVNERIAAVQRLTAARSDWVLFAADLQDRLAKTENAWVERLQPAAAGPVRISGPRPSPKPGKDPVTVRRSIPPARLGLAACLFDPDHPLDKPGEGSYQRAKALLADLRKSPFVAGVEEERFDASQPGVLRLEVTLVLAPGRSF